MCGIAAIVRREARPDPTGEMARMLEAQAHRGPDYRGSWRDPSGAVELGHDRLSIVDLSADGNQPLRNETGEVVVTVNGEIYNYAELRSQLEGEGHRFSSNSDSEVVAHLYERDGVDAVSQLIGMFAFVLHDTRTALTFAARDRLGKKPLVYAAWDGGVAFASEIPALLLLDGVDRQLDEEALGLYLLRNFRHVPDPHTLYRGIRRLPGGHAMVVREGAVERIWRYWRPSFVGREVSVEELAGRLDVAVRRRMQADTEIGALLSGGVDSSAIVESMRRQGMPGIRTYALGRDADDDELHRARAAADLLGTRHKELFFDPEQSHEDLRHLLRLHGDPVALLPLSHAYQLARHIHGDGLKVVMTGHGADEVFFGYSGHLQQAALTRVLPFVPRSAARAGVAVAERFGRSGLREAALAATAPAGQRKAALYLDEAARIWPALTNLAPDAQQDGRAAISSLFGTWFGDRPPKRYIDEVAVVGLFHENAHSVTIAADLPGMAASVEIRCPFLDHELVELGWQIDYRRKVGSRRDASQLKLVLKEALAQRLPHDLLYAPKRGFGFNIQEVDVLTGPWRARVAAGMDDLADSGMLRPDAVRRTWHEFLAHPDSHRAALVSKLYALTLAVTG